VRYLAILILLFFLGCAENINKVKVSENFKIDGGANLAILTFKSLGLPQSIGEKVAEKFSVEIVQSNKFKVIDRSNVKKIFEEIGFQANLDTVGGLDEKTRVKLKQAGAQYLMSGSIFAFDEKRRYEDGFVIYSKVHITAKLISIETGEVVWASEKLKESKAINAEEKKPKSILKVEIPAKSAERLLDDIVSEMTDNILSKIEKKK